MTTIAIKTLRKAIAFHDAVTRVLDKLRDRLDTQRAAYRTKLATKVQKLVDAEYVLQSKVVSEPYELREKLYKEQHDLYACFKEESDALLAQLQDIDSDANRKARATHVEVINKRIEELRKLVV